MEAHDKMKKPRKQGSARKQKPKNRKTRRQPPAKKPARVARLSPLDTIVAHDGTPRCGLCGKTENLTKTECCDNWICNDEDQYVIFSYARNSCYRNHRRFTLCGGHHAEEHDGDWKTCEACKEVSRETEMYVFYGTNEYNFETLPNPPSYKPTKCVKCGRIIRLGYEGYSHGPEGYVCENCSDMPAGLAP